MEHNCQNPVTDNVGTGADSQNQVVPVKILCFKYEVEDPGEYFRFNAYSVQEIKEVSKEGLRDAISNLSLRNHLNCDIDKLIFGLMSQGCAYLSEDGFLDEGFFFRYDERNFFITDGFSHKGKLFVEETFVN